MFLAHSSFGWFELPKGKPLKRRLTATPDMGSSKHYPSDFSVRLINEMEKLLTQLELYLKQAGTTATDETARLNEQYRAQSCDHAAEKEVSIENRNSEIEQARAALSELQRRLAALQNATTIQEQITVFPSGNQTWRTENHGRKWPAGGARKRRWKRS
jgi:hypothetical protein